jgi:hypothetical protein
MQNLQNIPSITVTDSTIGNYATIQTNGSLRIYIYRCTVTDWSRVLCAAWARIDMSYTQLNSYSYIQASVSWGVLTANYNNLSWLSYIRNLTANTHTAQRNILWGIYLIVEYLLIALYIVIELRLDAISITLQHKQIALYMHKAL